MAADLIRRTCAGLLVSVLLVACGREAARPPESQARPTSLLPRDRLELPEFGFAKFQALLRELRGTPVVVNIWGSWCPPCRVEAPDLAHVSREFEAGCSSSAWTSSTIDGPPRTSSWSSTGNTRASSIRTEEIRDRLGYIGQPVTIIYDRDGEEAFEWQGALTGDALRAEILKVLGE